MFDKSAIQEIAKAEAISAANNAFPLKSVVAFPNDFQMHDLEKYMQKRRRARGVMETSSIESFATYVESHKADGAAVFVSHQAMAANAVLNLGSPEAPGHADDRAQIKPDRTAAYTAMRNVAQGQALNQTQVAEFLEDWPGHIACFKDDAEVPLKHAIAAVRNITIEGMRKVEASEQQLSASKSTFEAVTASSKDPLPTLINFTCVPYQGFESRVFTLRLAIRTSDKPAITLRVVNSELQDEQMAEELATKVRAAIGSSCPVLIGDYTVKS